MFPSNGRFVSNHQKQYIRPIEDLFLIIRSKVSIQWKQFIQPLDERAAIYRNKFVYSFKLSIGGFNLINYPIKLNHPISQIYHNADSLKIGAFICESQNFNEFAIADQRIYRRQDSFC